MTIARRIGAVLGGMAVAWILVALGEAAEYRLYPPPVGANIHELAQLKKFVATLPLAALMLVMSFWLVSTLAGTFVAAKIARNRVPAYIVGALLLTAGIVNAFMIPQPVWFSILSFVVYIATTWMGARAGAPARAAYA